MTSPDPRRERYAGAITDHLWGSPEDIDEATSAVMEIADQEQQTAEAALARVRALCSPDQNSDQLGHLRRSTDVLAALDGKSSTPAPAVTEERP